MAMDKPEEYLAGTLIVLAPRAALALATPPAAVATIRNEPNAAART
jgi:hypothetical protein